MLWDYSYDGNDRLKSEELVVTGNKAFDISYLYNGNMKRVRSIVDKNDGSGPKTIYNVYDLSGRLVHVEDDGEVTDYLHGMGQTLARIKDGEFTYLHPDHLGSPQLGTNEAGGVVFTENYTPFGEELNGYAANDNQSGFTGHIKDKSTGLNYMQARYYDPNIGRFLSVDPMDFVGSGNDPRYFNRYSYTANDPINLIDPTGAVFCPGGDGCDAELAAPTVVQTKGIDTIGNNSDGRFAQGHAFNEITNPRTGESVVMRGGSEHGTSGGLASILTGLDVNAGGKIQVDLTSSADSVDTQRIDAKGLGVENISTNVVNQSFDEVVATAQKFTNTVNDAGIPYLGLGTNSNSVAFTGRSVLTGQPHQVESPLKYPGGVLNLCKVAEC